MNFACLGLTTSDKLKELFIISFPSLPSPSSSGQAASPAVESTPK
jgi:hypothetical protein